MQCLGGLWLHDASFEFFSSRCADAREQHIRPAYPDCDRAGLSTCVLGRDFNKAVLRATLEVLLKEGRDGCQDARLGCGTEVVPFVRQDLRLMGDAETREEGMQIFRMVKAYDRICLAVEDQSRGKGRGGAFRVRTDEAAGDIHDAARDSRLRRGGLGSQSQRKERA
jgi:hypothetical protein